MPSWNRTISQFHNPENLKCSFRRCSIMYPKKSVCHIRRSSSESYPTGSAVGYIERESKENDLLPQKWNARCWQKRNGWFMLVPGVCCLSKIKPTKPDRITSGNLTISGMLNLSISFLAYGVAERSLLRQLHLYGNLELAVEMAVWMNNLKRRLQSQLSSGYCYTCANIRMYEIILKSDNQRTTLKPWAHLHLAVASVRVVCLSLETANLLVGWFHSINCAVMAKRWMDGALQSHPKMPVKKRANPKIAPARMW